MGLSRGRALLACGVLSTLAIAVWACSQGDPQPGILPDPPNDASTTKGGDSSGGDASKVTCLGDDGGCNTLQNCGSKVFIVQVAQAGPSGQGGTVLDGTYILTDYRVFTGDDGGTGTLNAYFSETMTLVTAADDAGTSDGGSTSQEMVWQDNIASNSAPTSASSSGIAQFNGSTVTITHTCPNANVFTGTYTMSSTQLLFFVQDTTGTGQLTYTKQ